MIKNEGIYKFILDMSISGVADYIVILVLVTRNYGIVDGMDSYPTWKYSEKSVDWRHQEMTTFLLTIYSSELTSKNIKK